MNSDRPNSERPNSQRIQVTISISRATYERLEELSERTNLSRSRLYELACIKFADWSAIVPADLILILSQKLGPDLGYQRRQSGFRKAVPAPKPSDPYSTHLVPGVVKTNPRNR